MNLTEDHKEYMRNLNKKIENTFTDEEKVNSPSHYQGVGGLECIYAIEAATEGKTGLEAVCVANVIKYLWRYEAKNGLEDVKKAQWYLNKLIKRMEENG